MSGAIEGRFMFAQGLKESIVVPAGTLEQAQAHVQRIEQRLGLVAEKYLDNPSRWGSTAPTVDVTDEELCSVAREHDEWIDWLWDRLGEWHETPPTGATEMLTPEAAATFWHGTQAIDVPTARWDRQFYRKRMEEVYEILRGRPVCGVHWGSKPLTPQQAAGVLWLLAEHLGIDVGDQRLEAPREWQWDPKARRMKLVQLDEIQPSNSYDGDGYEWCEKCGAIAVDYDGDTGCPRSKSKCPIKRDRS